MTAKTSRGGAAESRRQVWAEGASIAPDCSGARSGVRRGADRGSRAAMRSVALAHGVEARGRVGVEQRAMAFDQGDDVLAEIPPAGRPLVVRAAAVVVRAVEARCPGMSGAAIRRSPRGGRASEGSPAAGGRRRRNAPRRPGGRGGSRPRGRPRIRRSGPPGRVMRFGLARADRHKGTIRPCCFTVKLCAKQCLDR